ncbi:MAG TPA: hypothetical protein VKT83_03275 [bacterium]|nr:hypothetical protein [bacterium]
MLINRAVIDHSGPGGYAQEEVWNNLPGLVSGSTYFEEMTLAFHRDDTALGKTWFFLRTTHDNLGVGVQRGIAILSRGGETPTATFDVDGSFNVGIQHDGSAKATIYADGSAQLGAISVASCTGCGTPAGNSAATGPRPFAAMVLNSAPFQGSSHLMWTGPNGVWSSGETSTGAIIGQTGVLVGLYLHLLTAPGERQWVTFTVMHNGTPTALSVVIGDTVTDRNDTAHTVSVNAGDRISLQLSSSPGAPVNSVLATVMER